MFPIHKGEAGGGSDGGGKFRSGKLKNFSHLRARARAHALISHSFSRVRKHTWTWIINFVFTALRQRLFPSSEIFSAFSSVSSRKLDGARTQERFRSPTRWQRVVNFPSDTKLHRSARGSLILNNAAKRDVRNTRDTRTSQMNGKRDKTGLKGSKIHDDRVTESRGRDAIKISSRSSRAFWSALTLQSHLLLGLQNSFNGKRKSNACPWRTTAKANR